MTWQEELKELFRSDWYPEWINGQFMMRKTVRTLCVRLRPPQGIFANWLCIVESSEKNFTLHVTGHSASDVLWQVNSRIPTE